MTEQQETRYEIKTPFNPVEMPRMRSLVRAHPACFKKQWPERTVNNLYFDSENYSCLEDGLQGVAERGKLRLRWYGEGQPAPPFRLEWKAKHGMTGEKLVIQPRIEEPLEGISPGRLSGLLADCGDPCFAELASRYRFPAVVNRYRRDYFVSADGTLRLTLDFKLRFVQQATRDHLTLAGPELKATFCVMELKFPGSSERQAVEALNRFPLRSGACSKYTLGLVENRPLG